MFISLLSIATLVITQLVTPANTQGTPSNSPNIEIPTITTTIMPSSHPSCDGANERYTFCASSSCFEDTCIRDVLFPIVGHKICTTDCKRGCQCIPGYYRNHDGRCVDEITCVMCGYRQDWKDFNDSDAGEEVEPGSLEKSCDDVLGTDIVEDEMTTFENIMDFVPPAGCYCADGYFRAVDGLCVTEVACRECSLNEVYKTCGSSSCWEYTCADVDVPLNERLTRPCTKDCRQGCKCHPGFYRDLTTRNCVLPSMCT
mmetsp:Transcript_7400/g.8115  ORF Transcript_7400/g.8115 Transcript_7400/m.8115 type:complete len:257 (+) Transcript_7400:284-1054(+)